jgi:hypothetical protein
MSTPRITCGHCACGEYKSPNLIAEASCRKSSGSPDSSLGVAHLLRYQLLNDEGLKELGYLIEDMYAYGCDYIRIEQIEN